MSNTGFIGVHTSGKTRFTSSVWNNDRKVYLGVFSNAFDAATERDRYIIDNNLTHRLNFKYEEPENLIPNTRLIKLTRGKFAIVDEEDFEWLNAFNWHVEIGYNTFYAARTIQVNGSRNVQKMHRLIMGDDNKDIDHKNRNGLHNYKSNLRCCTNSQNQANKKTTTGTSVHKGVVCSNNRIRSRITVNKKVIHLGYFKSETEAAKAYDNAAKQYFGEFARTNF